MSKTRIAIVAAAFMLGISQPVLAGGNNCQGVFMNALFNIAAIPVAVLQGVQNVITAGESPCSCSSNINRDDSFRGTADVSVKVVSAPAPTAVAVPAMPAYVTYQVMPAVQTAVPPGNGMPNTYFYAPLPFRQ